MSASYFVEPGAGLQGRITVPGDKSISHRSFMFAAVAEGESRLSGVLESEDCLATRDALLALGASIERTGPGQYRVQGAGRAGLSEAAGDIDCGNSGTGMRLLAGLLAGQNVPARLIGDASLMSRPMARVAEPLRAMGAQVNTGPDGRPPLDIGRAQALRAMTHRPSVASAQVKSAILLAGLGARGVTQVVEPAASRDHTERMLAAFGAQVTIDGLSVAVRGPQVLEACDVEVPGDPSSAAFFAVAATLVPGSDLTLVNVGMNPGRSGFLDVLERMGARIDRLDPRRVGGEPVCDLRVRHAVLRGIDVPPEWVPRSIDEFPALFVAAGAARGTTRVTGAAELRVKESDRIGAMAEGLQALGIAAQATADGMIVEGGRFGGGTVHSRGDHRIAMAFAAAAAGAVAPVTIADTDNVATSFPGFASLARDVGWRVHER